MKMLQLVGAGCLMVCLQGIDIQGMDEIVPDVVAIATKTAPKIDGVLDDVAWVEVAKNHHGVMSGWTFAGLAAGRGLTPQQRIGYVCYDAENLYVAMQAMAVDPYNKLKTGSNAFNGDCLEIHINTPENKYFQFGIDIEGTISLGQTPSGTRVDTMKGKSEIGLNFWATEVAIPWKLLGVTPKSGLHFGFNLAANNANQGIDAWTPVSWGKTFFVRNNETVIGLK